MSFPRRRRAALVALVAGALAATVSAAHARHLAAPGWRFVMKSTTTISGGRGGARAPQQPGTQVMTVRLQGGRARIDMQGSGSEAAMTGRDGYLLLESGSGRLTMVNTREKKALVIDGAMFDGGGPMAAMLDIAVSDVTMDVRDLGPGATLLGQPTRKYRVTQGYVTTTTFKGMPGMPRGAAPPGPQVMRTRSVHDLEVAPDLAKLDPAFEAFAQRFLRGAREGSGMKALAAASAKWPKGLALRSRATVTTSTGGDSTTAVIETLVTEYGAVEVDPAALAVPAGVQVTEMSRLMRPGARGRP